MRISTSQIFDSGARGIGRNQVDLFKLQNQMSTGRKVLTPEDDPIAASQALVLTQSKAVSAQFLKNQSDAQGKLSIVETQVASVGDLLQNVRERLVQAGSTTLTNSDRSYIAMELEARFSELMGIANAQDAEGNYLFSGYQGGVKPFSATTAGADYQGDDGQRLLQVDPSRQMATNVTGKDLFTTIRNGNGVVATSTAGNAGGTNLGSGIVDQGGVTSQSDWTSAINNPALWTNTPPDSIQIGFAVDVATGKLQYSLYEEGVALAISGPTDFVSGQSIALANGATSLGVSVVITGQPVAGDTFAVAPSENQSIFATLRNAINALTQGVGGSNTTTEYANDFAGSLQNVDQALENVNKIRSTVGSNLKELDSLAESGADLQLQYDSSLSALQDLDYAEAISEMAKKKLQLEAAQLSFKQISQLSLFNVL